MNFDYATLLPQVIAIARQAGETILRYYHAENDIDIEIKSDKSPVTEADKASDQLIRHGLQALTPSWPVMSEESPIPSFAERQQWDYFWCVDPLDGTKGFIRKTDDFVVNIALVKQNKAILGVIYSPTQDTVYYSNEFSSAYRQVANTMPSRIHAKAFTGKDITVALSKFHRSEKLEKMTKQFGKIHEIQCGSAIKMCYVAEGQADLAPRLGPTSAWDTAAGQCIVEQAGGQIIDLQGQPLRYNTQESLLNPSFLVVADPSYNWSSLF